VHGEQEGRFFHGLLWAYLLTCRLYHLFCGRASCVRGAASNIDCLTGKCQSELKRIVEQIRFRVAPGAYGGLRVGTPGFCRGGADGLGCAEANRGRVTMLGLAKNEGLKAEIAQEQKEAQPGTKRP